MTDTSKGGQSGVARARTPRQLERQEKVFVRSVLDGRSDRQIAKEMGLSRKTVRADILAESYRRADEMASQRDVARAEHLSLLQDLYQRSLALAKTPGSGALNAAAKCLEQRSKLLGLDQPSQTDPFIEKLLAALDGD